MKNALYTKWVETSTETTTAFRRNNNNNKTNTIRCKVDGRVVCQVSKIIDTCHTESARASANHSKIVSDKFKPAAESKCTIDDISTFDILVKERALSLLSLQIFGFQANACSLHLLDRGFYVNCVDFDISLSTSLKHFADNLLVWIRNLALLKKLCKSIASLSNQAYNKQPATLSGMFNLQKYDDSANKYCNQNWMTGTLLAPTSKKLF